MITLTTKRIYLGIAGLFALNAALFLVPIVPLRLATAIGILFLTPGVFVVRILYPAQKLESLEGLVLTMLASVALNLLFMFGLNVVVHVPFNDLAILVSLAALSAFFALADFVVCSNRGGRRK